MKVNAKLVKRIKDAHKSGQSIISISRDVGLGYTTVRSIVKNTHTQAEDPESEFFDFHNRCVITGFLQPRERDSRL